LSEHIKRNAMIMKMIERLLFRNALLLPKTM
jgi:hypothetical protein